MKKLSLILIALCSFHISVQAEELVGAPGENYASSEGGSPNSPPSVKDLYNCASASAGGMFDVNISEGLTAWRASYEGDKRVSIQAMSLWLKDGADGEGSAFITLTPDQVLYTKAPMQHSSIAGDETLGANLHMKMSQVQMQDVDGSKTYATKGPWAHAFDYGLSFIPQENYVEIRDQDKVVGARGQQMMILAEKTLRRRMQNATRVVQAFAALRRTSSRIRSKGFYYQEVDELREGLCGCQQLFPREVSDAIKGMTSGQPINFETQDGRIRILKPADLFCGAIS